MQGVQADDNVVASFAKFKNLDTLEISWTKITPLVFQRLPVMPKVTTIMIKNTSANDETLRDIAAKFPNLKSLHIQGTNVTDQGLHYLKNLKLKTLYVFNCNLSRKAIAELQESMGPGLAIHHELGN